MATDVETHWIEITIGIKVGDDRKAYVYLSALNSCEGGRRGCLGRR